MQRSTSGPSHRALALRVLESLGLPVDERRVELAFHILLSSLNTILESAGISGLEALLERWEVKGTPLEAIKRLPHELIEALDALVGEIEPLPVEEMQVLAPRTLPQSERKRLASYYTVDVGTEYMARLTREYSNRLSQKRITLGDPFLGTARTLTKTIRLLGRERVELAYGVEPHLLAALVAYAALLRALRDPRRVRVYWGDAFHLLLRGGRGLLSYLGEGTVDPRVFETNVILTNPPFTRWSNLPSEYRRGLLESMRRTGYSKYIERGDPSLQILSLLLIDAILAPRGLLSTVLPAATFYTRSGVGLKRLLREKYSILALLENSDSSFSMDSGFKEVILTAVKDPSYSTYTVVARLTRENLDSIVEAALNPDESVYAAKVNLRSLPGILDRNWLSLFQDPDLVSIVSEVLEHGLETGVLAELEHVLGRHSIVRGVEMYGVDFFFIPNKHWSIVEEHEDSILIRNERSGLTLSIDKRYLEPILRKPQNYATRIRAEPDTYALAIPPETDINDLDDDIRRYIEWGEESGTAEPAITAWKKYWRPRIPHWYAHIGYQIRVKRPRGRVFLPDKVDLKFARRGVYANYTDTPTLATKNFYVMRVGDDDTAKALALWYNSIVFLAIFHVTSKRISDTYARLLEEDHLKTPVLDTGRVDTRALALSLDRVKDIVFENLETQLRVKPSYRVEIDEIIFKTININSSYLEKLYNIILKKLNR